MFYFRITRVNTEMKNLTNVRNVQNASTQVISWYFIWKPMQIKSRTPAPNVSDHSSNLEIWNITNIHFTELAPCSASCAIGNSPAPSGIAIT